MEDLAKMLSEDFKRTGGIDEDGNVYLQGVKDKVNIAKVDTGEVGKILHSHFSKSELAKNLWKLQPYFYDRSRIWWLWNVRQFKWEKVDDKDILIMVSKNSMENTVNSKEKTEILEAMQQFGRTKIPLDVRSTWIQFQDTIVDIESGDEFKATPEFFVTNPIPWKLNKDRFVNTPNMDRIFEEWVGPKYTKALYQIIAYCMLPSYPIHRIFCFIGEGMNGKSKFLELLRKFVGQFNCCATELDTLLSSKFEVTRLHKKLVCQMGETDFNEMKKTGILKKLSGGDLVGFEYKNKDPFEEENYSKIIIATNNLPATSDKTIGYYRRWMIIDFPNQFSEKKDILADIPDEEFEFLTVKLLGILKDLLDDKQFHNEGSIEDRMKKYEDHSDPIEKFLKEMTEQGDLEKDYIPRWELSKILISWLKENRFRVMNDKFIGQKMREKGFEEKKPYIDIWDDGAFKKRQIRSWMGIKWKGEKRQDG